MAVNIDVGAEIDSIRLTEQESAPAPDGGYSHIFAKADGLYIVDDDDVVTGPLGGRVLIETVSPSGTGTVTFSDIVSTFTSLELEVMGRSTKTGSGGEGIKIYFNGDSTDANYRRGQTRAFGTTLDRVQGDDSVMGFISANDAPANSCGTVNAKILDYSNTTFYKQLRSVANLRSDNSSLYEVTHKFSVEWESTSAISSISVILKDSGNFVAGSKLRLYGLN